MSEAQEKRLVLLATLAIGLIAVLPHVITPVLTPKDTPYVPMFRKAITAINEDEVTLAPFMNHAFRGDVVIPRETFLYEHRFTPTPREWLPHLMTAVIRLLTGSVTATFIFGDLILAPLHFISLYVFIFYLTRTRIWSLLTALSVLFLSSFVEYIPPMNLSQIQRLFFTAHSFTSSPPFFFTRLPTGELTGIFFWAALFWFFRTIDKPKQKNAMILGLLSGLLFYLYTYYWEVFWLGSFFVFCLLLALRELNSVKVMPLAIGVGVLVSIPFWWEVMNFMKLPFSSEIWLEYGARQGRFIFKFLTLKFSLILILGLWLSGFKDRKALILACFFLAGLVCLNQQVILGKAIEPEHWPDRILGPWTLVYLGYCLKVAWTRFQHSSRQPHPLVRFCGILGIGLILIWGAWIQIDYSLKSKFSHPLFKEMSPHLKAFEWLRQHTTLSDVVLSCNPEIIDLIGVYTPNYSFLQTTGTSNSSYAEVMERIFIAYRLLGVEDDFLTKQLEASHDDPARWEYFEKYIGEKQDPTGYLKETFQKDSWLYSFFFHRYYFDKQMLQLKPLKHSPEILEKINKGGYRYVPPEERKNMLEAYRNLPSDLALLLGHFKLDYIYLGPYERKIEKRDFDHEKFFRKVYESPDEQVTIYQVVFPQPSVSREHS